MWDLRLDASANRAPHSLQTAGFRIDWISGTRICCCAQSSTIKLSTQTEQVESVMTLLLPQLQYVSILQKGGMRDLKCDVYLGGDGWCSGK